MGKRENRPSDDCFGEWIPEHLSSIKNFYGGLKHNFWKTEIDAAKAVAYDQIDMIFLND